MLSQIERTTQEIGRYLFDHLGHSQPSVLDRRWWDDRIMAWAMRDESVKVQMFRFIDVLPMLGTPAIVNRHLQEYLGPVRARLPAAARLGLEVARTLPPAGRALSVMARKAATANARR